MDWSQYYQLGRDLAMLAIAMLVFYWGRDREATAKSIDAKFKSASESVAAAFALRDERYQELRSRVDKGSAESSRLASVVQGMIGIEERMRREVNAGIVEARHSAMDALTVRMSTIGSEKVDARVHEIQIAELQRRLSRLEEQQEENNK